MSLSIGIVGLPNVGKSTTFNALTRAQHAEVANYPFCTIKPNRAIVPVPDQRIDNLGEMIGREKVIHATIEFVDIAGLVKDAHKGEGLGNQFLGNIRDTDAILHIVRCFDDPNVIHVSEHPDPLTDIETIETELALADLEQLEKKIEKLERQIKGDRKLKPFLDATHALIAHLNTGAGIRTFPGKGTDPVIQLERELRFLTAKPVIFAANVGEDGLMGENQYLQAVRTVAAEKGAEVVVLCANLEAETVSMSEEERSEFLEMVGAEESALDQVIRRSYETLGLISFFTYNDEEVRAWTLPKDSTAPQAAGSIHTDFERGFIRAEVTPFDIFASHGSATAVRAAGALGVEGKDYIVQDGDILLIRFNL